MYKKSWHGPKCQSLSSFSYCKEYLYIRNIFIPTLPSLWRLSLLHLIKFGFTSLYSLSVKSYSNFPKLCFFMLCYTLYLPLFLSDPARARGVSPIYYLHILTPTIFLLQPKRNIQWPNDHEGKKLMLEELHRQQIAE